MMKKLENVEKKCLENTSLQCMKSLYQTFIPQGIKEFEA